VLCATHLGDPIQSPAEVAGLAAAVGGCDDGGAARGGICDDDPVRAEAVHIQPYLQAFRTVRDSIIVPTLVKMLPVVAK